MFKSLKNSALLVKPGKEGDQQRVEALEQQIQMLATAASQAVDRANELERELEDVKSQRGLKKLGSFSTHRSSSSSVNSLFSNASKSSAGTDVVTMEKIDYDNKLEALIQAKEEALKALEEEKSRRICSEKRETALKAQIDELKASRSEGFNKKIDRDQRLHKLDVALTAIEHARATLNSPRFFRYV